MLKTCWCSHSELKDGIALIHHSLMHAQPTELNKKTGRRRTEFGSTRHLAHVVAVSSTWKIIEAHAFSINYYRVVNWLSGLI